MPFCWLLDNKVTPAKMFQNRVHLGHKIQASSPIMYHFIYARVHDVAVFDLVKTAQYFKHALEVARYAGR